ncbi:MAG: sensor histidine kinase [Bryobacteraceae bacterium]
MERTPSSPTPRLMAGLVVTLVAVCVFSWFSLVQIAGLRDLQTRVVDRNRRDSLQLLRIQSNLNSLAIAIRDMISGDEPYPLEAYKGQFERLRMDLDDAMRLEQKLAPAERSPDRQHFLADSLTRLWGSLDRAFALAAAGHDQEARETVRTTTQAEQASVTFSVSRLLVQNYEAEDQAMARIQQIYVGVERNVYVFVAAMLLSLSFVSLYLIYSNRRLFERLASLSGERRDLARKLITMQEEVLRSISRELHDEFGQILTAIGAMLTRAAKQNVPDSFKEDVREVRDVAQHTLERVRSLSLVLHPSILDEGGLEQAVDWYLPVFQKQTGIAVTYNKTGASEAIPDTIAIHVYRVLQEALNNVARHARSQTVSVRLHFGPTELELEVRDQGVGPGSGEDRAGRRGIGMVAMRERAELLKGGIEFLHPPGGGTLVRLRVPVVDGAETSERRALASEQ